MSKKITKKRIIVDKIKTVHKHFKKTDPIIYKAMRSVDFGKWLAPNKNPSGQIYFQELCLNIIGQQLSGKAASKISERFLLFLGKPVSPEKLIKSKDQDLRDLGLSWAKVSYVKNIAYSYLDGSVEFEKFPNMPDEKIISELVNIKGVGPWTAEMFLIFTLGREDVFSNGDLGLKKSLTKLYGLNTLNADEIKTITDKWIPYRTYGSITLWHSIENK